MLKDPRQKRFFSSRDMHDLFTLGDEYAEGTETGAIFSSVVPEVVVEQGGGAPGARAGAACRWGGAALEWVQ